MSTSSEDPPAKPTVNSPADLVMRVIESAAGVQRRHQFFIWVQGYLHTLLPHNISACAAWHRVQKELVFETFHTVPVAADLLDLLGNGRSALMCELVRQWIERSGGSVIVDVEGLDGRVPAADMHLLREAKIFDLLAHGVARPQRPKELESLFVLTTAGRRWTQQHRVHMDLLLPHLHTTYMRAHINERELGSPVDPALTLPTQEFHGSQVTARERQILRWVRDGKTNAEIAIKLSISPLTVKNHVQKILRKLTAANRAQAVAMAIQRDLL